MQMHIAKRFGRDGKPLSRKVPKASRNELTENGTTSGFFFCIEGFTEYIRKYKTDPRQQIIFDAGFQCQTLVSPIRIQANVVIWLVKA